MITQLSTLKSRLKIDAADTADDAILSLLITACLGLFEGYCNRAFVRTVGAQEEFQGDLMVATPRRVPIESVTGFDLKSDESTGWVAQTGVRYLIGPRRQIIVLDQRLGLESELVRITFTGGFVMPGTAAAAGQTALPPVIENAALQQITHWFQQRDRLGLSSISGEGGAVSQLASGGVIPAVKAALSSWVRTSM